MGRQRCEQLGHVELDRASAGIELREAEVDDPGMIRTVDHHVGRSQRTMRDAHSVQCGHLAPQLLQHLVGHPVVGEVRQTGAVDEVHHQHHRAVRALDDTVDRRGVHAGALRHHPDQRLMFDGLLQRGGRTHVADVAQSNRPVDPIEEIGVTLVLAEDLDEEPIALRVRHHEWAGALAAHGDERSGQHGEAAGLECGHHLLRTGATIGSTERDEQAGADGDADCECDDQLHRQHRAGNQPGNGDEAQREPRGTFPRDGEPPSDDDRDCRGARQEARGRP